MNRYQEAQSNYEAANPIEENDDLAEKKEIAKEWVRRKAKSGKELGGAREVVRPDDKRTSQPSGRKDQSFKTVSTRWEDETRKRLRTELNFFDHPHYSFHAKGKDKQFSRCAYPDCPRLGKAKPQFICYECNEPLCTELGPQGEHACFYRFHTDQAEAMRARMEGDDN